MSMNLNKWHSYLNGDFNKILNDWNEDESATISNSVFLQVFKYDKSKANLWELVGTENKTSLNEIIDSNNLNCTDTQHCKKELADDWGLFQFNIPRKNCSTVEVEESLSRFGFFKFSELDLFQHGSFKAGGSQTQCVMSLKRSTIREPRTL